jgi:hypothetical protein
MAHSSSRPLAGYGLIGLGLLFLITQLTGWSILGAFWPFIVMAPGLAFLYAAYTGGIKQADMAIPGSIVTGIGGILLFQNLTGHWQSWAYAWALIPMFIGFGLSYAGQRKSDAKMLETGQGMVRWGGLAFIAFAAFFELFIFGAAGGLSGLLIPALLIGGGFLVLRQRGHSAGSQHEVVVPVVAESRLMDEKPKRDGVLAGDALQKRIDEVLAESDKTQQPPIV